MSPKVSVFKSPRDRALRVVALCGADPDVPLALRAAISVVGGELCGPPQWVTVGMYVAVVRDAVRATRRGAAPWLPS